MNIEGLSETTLEKLIGHGWIHTFADLYDLEQHRDAIIQTDGFGEKSFERLQAAIEKSRSCTLAKFIAGLGIPTVGRHAGRALERCFAGSWEAFEAAIQKGFDFTQLPDFGAVMQENIYTWYADAEEAKLWRPLLEKIQFIKETTPMSITKGSPLYGKIVVATGKLEHYTRDGIQNKLLEIGAIPASSVTKKTNYLIVGEKAGSKLTKAQQLGVPTLTEEEFEVIKRHPIIGASILKNLALHQDEPIVKVAYEICRWHHERYDGGGYPDGLKGEQIPISAQIVSLADVYDALVSDRIYKKAYSHKEAVRMILAGECGAFNPLLLECLEEIQGKIKEELEVQDVPEISPVPVQCPISEISELSMPEDKK